jgi:phosphoribosylanthranilate isomerase
MTRPGDVEAGVAAGARYIGVIFAPGPRTVTVDQARVLMSRVPPQVSRVGVFGREASPETVARTGSEIGLDVIQLHGDPTPEAVAEVRGEFDGAVWAAVRVREPSLGDAALDLFGVADAVVLDAYSPHALGGTGIQLAWAELAPALDRVRGRAKVVLAGGLEPQSVATAVRILRPDVVDVSSGVEVSPGIKDHAKLRAFSAAVLGEAETGR